MLDREPFLKAIFAAPEDNLPRLVFADYLEETGEDDWAKRLRQECEADPSNPYRGFNPPSTITITQALLDDADQLRLTACSIRPEWYAARSLKVESGKITSANQLQNLLANPVTEHVTEVDFSGLVTEEVVSVPETGEMLGLQLFDMVIKPVITVPMVEHLAQMREVRRLTKLYLQNNELDNDAARALVRSPHLFRLVRLSIYQGSRLKARTWQQLVERFGENVVE